MPFQAQKENEVIDTKELRRLAQAATPGPWQFWHGGVAANIDSDGRTIIVERPTPSGGKYQARVDGNFRFIAAATPAAINELLDRLEVAEKERDKYKSAYIEWCEKTEWVHDGITNGAISPKYLGWHRADIAADLLKKAENEVAHIKEVEFPRKMRAVAAGWETKCARLEQERDALRAKIEAMEKQEPVAWISSGGDVARSKAFMDEVGFACAPLYLAPGAKGEEK